MATKKQKEKNKKIFTVFILVLVFIVVPLLIILKPWKNNMDWVRSTIQRLKGSATTTLGTHLDSIKEMGRWKTYWNVRGNLKNKGELKSFI